jgi:hypothetical protein
MDQEGKGIPESTKKKGGLTKKNFSGNGANQWG